VDLTHDLIAGEATTLMRALPIEPGRVRSRRLFKGSGVTVVGIAIDAGAAMHEHRAAVPILLQVLEGLVSVGLPAGQLELPTGAVIHIEANVPHGVEGLTQARLLLLLLDATPTGAEPLSHDKRDEDKAHRRARTRGTPELGAARMVLATSGADAAAVDAIAGAHSELSGALAYAANHAFDPNASTQEGAPSWLSQLLEWCHGPLAAHLSAEHAAFGPILDQLDPALAERVRAELAAIQSAIVGLSRAPVPGERSVAIVRIRILLGRHLRTMDEVVLPVIAGTATLSLADTWKRIQRHIQEVVGLQVVETGA
jgi:quercetin dioxygenase-like cupin family protein